MDKYVITSVKDFKIVCGDTVIKEDHTEYKLDPPIDAEDNAAFICAIAPLYCQCTMLEPLIDEDDTLGGEGHIHEPKYFHLTYLDYLGNDILLTTQNNYDTI